MKLQFLGSGTAFTPLADNFHSNMVLESPSGKRLLIDCGSDARHSAGAVNLTSKDFDAVYISHFHADHAGGLEWMALTTKFDPTAKKPKLIIHPSMVQRLWDNVLSGGLQTIQEYECTIETFFDIYPMKDGIHFEWESIPFTLVQTQHVYHNGELIPSYGIFFKTPKNKVYITTDTQFKPDLYMKYYLEADIIFHDCEISKYSSCVHSDFSKLDTLDPAIKKKMWLYHYLCDELPDPAAHGFAGFVKRRQIFDV